MNKLVICALAVFMSASPFGAVAYGEPSITVSSSVGDKYLGFNTGFLLSKSPVLQSDAFVAFPRGLYLDLWNSRTLKGRWDDQDFGNETDYCIGWGGSVAKGASLDASAVYFDEPKPLKFGAGDIVLLRAALSKNVTSLLSASIGIEDFSTMPKTGYSGGMLFPAGLRFKVPLIDDRVRFVASAAMVYDTGTFGGDRGFLARGNIGADWSVTKRLTMKLNANWYVPVTVHDRRTTDAMVTIGASYTIN